MSAILMVKIYEIKNMNETTSSYVLGENNSIVKTDRTSKKEKG